MPGWFSPMWKKIRINRISSYPPAYNVQALKSWKVKKWQKNQEIKYSIEADEEINQILLVGKDVKLSMTEIYRWINESEWNVIK